MIQQPEDRHLVTSNNRITRTPTESHDDKHQPRTDRPTEPSDQGVRKMDFSTTEKQNERENGKAELLYPRQTLE